MYKFSTNGDYRGIKLVELNKENVEFAEALINNDSNYIKCEDPDAGPVYIKCEDPDAEPVPNYSGSSAYWYKEFCKGETYEKFIKEIVQSIDRENSTHLNANKIGWNLTVSRIIHLCSNTEELKKELADTTNYGLINTIASNTDINEGYCAIDEIEFAKYKEKIDDTKKKDGKNLRHRENFSFATKFCHFMSINLLKRDIYSKYDNIVSKVLGFYITEDNYKKYSKMILKRVQPWRNIKDKTRIVENLLFKCGGKPSDRYNLYQRIILDIINGSGAEISRTELDHLLWYYYKGRLYKLNYFNNSTY